jgi:glycine/D-amino acid oxidase-like deaminating enzyme
MRTIVVGAGIAGLWIAEQLQNRGDDVIVLEQDKRVGGRIATSKHGYEIGAGRLDMSHRRIMALVERFGLDTIPLSHDVSWKALGLAVEPNDFATVWTPIIRVLEKAGNIHRHTLRSLATQTLGPTLSNNILIHFGYRAELDTLRADLGIRAFKHEMGPSSSFAVVKGGLSQLTTGLAAELDVRLGVAVQNVVLTNGVYHVKTSNTPPFECDRVILAIPAPALKKLPCLSGFRTLDYLQMKPLTRIYAQTDGPAPAFLTKRIITDSPLRYIIPVGKDLIMISYTESQDTEFWRGLKGPALITKLQKELRRLFPTEQIPDFKWARAYEWSGGCTYWIPSLTDNYDPAAESKKALRPIPKMPHLHLCGESFSLRQAWIEGALEHAAELLAML